MVKSALDENNHNIANDNEEEIIYLYPDLAHVIKGTFKVHVSSSPEVTCIYNLFLIFLGQGSKLVCGRFGVVTGVSWTEDGIPDLKV